MQKNKKTWEKRTSTKPQLCIHFQLYKATIKHIHALTHTPKIHTSKSQHRSQNKETLCFSMPLVHLAENQSSNISPHIKEYRTG